MKSISNPIYGAFIRFLEALIMLAVIALMLMGAAVAYGQTKPATLLMMRSSTIPLYITNGVKILQYQGTSNPITGQPNYMQIYPPMNTNSASLHWISIAWQTPTNLEFTTIEKCTDLTKGDWKFYEAFPPQMTNMIDPILTGNRFYRIGKPITVIFPTN